MLSELNIFHSDTPQCVYYITPTGYQHRLRWKFGGGDAISTSWILVRGFCSKQEENRALKSFHMTVSLILSSYLHSPSRNLNKTTTNKIGTATKPTLSLTSACLVTSR